MAHALPPFVSWSEAMDHRARDPHTVFADTRWYWDRPGRDAWLTGHVPGAVFIDLTSDLSGTVTTASGRQPLPTPEAFATAMSRAGIDGDHPVFAYDDAGGVIAARLVWMLRCLNIDAAVISGGITAFDGALWPGEESSQPQHVIFKPRPWPEDCIVTTQQIAEAVLAEHRPALHLIDARPPNRFRGENPEIDPRLGVVPQADPRAGHIPTATNLPCRDNLEPDGHIKAADQLRATFTAAGIDTDNVSQVVSYCGSGVTACHTLLALECAGLGQAKLYPGSWSAWSRTPHLPVAT